MSVILICLQIVILARRPTIVAMPHLPPTRTTVSPMACHSATQDLDPPEPYPAWSAGRQIPMSTEEIEDIFLDLTQKFGFQRDSMRNMVSVILIRLPLKLHSLTWSPRFDFTMQLLDSRASRMSPNQALLTLHADYIGGQHANYRKWYFAAQLNLDDAVGQTNNPGLQRLRGGHQGGAPKDRWLQVPWTVRSSDGVTP